MLLPPSLLPVEAAEAERGTPSAATGASEPSPKPRYGLLARLLLAVPVLLLLLPAPTDADSDDDEATPPTGARYPLPPTA